MPNRSPSVLPPDYRWLLFAACGMLGFATLLGFVGITSGPPRRLYNYTTQGAPLIQYGWMHLEFLILYAASAPGRKEMLSVMAGGLLGGVASALSMPEALRGDSATTHWIMAFVFSGGLASIIAMTIRWLKMNDARAAALTTVGLSNFLFAGFVGDYLQLTLKLNPQTLDYVAFRIDHLLGFDPSVFAATQTTAWGLRGFFDLVYDSIPFTLVILFAWTLRSSASSVFSLPLAWVWTLLVFPLYLLMPVSGPAYLFGADFPMATAKLLDIAPQWGIVGAAFRNGIPSMHMGLALLTWLGSRVLAPRWLHRMFGIFALLTVIATLANGEHYLIDLVISFPFIVGVLALASIGLGWNNPRRLQSLLIAGGTLVFWIVALRNSATFLIANPPLAVTVQLITIALPLWSWFRLEKVIAQQKFSGSLTGVGVVPHSDGRPSKPVPVFALFVLSGLAGLIYEVLFAKELALVFGSTSAASYTVLAVYMGGMAIGAWIGGIVADRSNRPIVLYALAEFAIGLYCALTPLIFDVIQGAYISMASGQAPDAPMLLPLRVALGSVALLVPTVLMGMTLPILVRHCERSGHILGDAISKLYGANTVGAALGALISGYLIIPALGVNRTTLFAAGINLLVAFLALRLFKSRQRQGRKDHVANGAPVYSVTQLSVSKGYVATAFAVLGVGGAVTLALEVHYMHLLAIVAGNSVYAFALMLFTFLLALALGSDLGRRLLLSRFDTLVLLGVGQTGLGLIVWAGIRMWDSFPGYFSYYEHYPVLKTFAEYEFVRGFVCFTAMFPPAFIIGCSYPLAMSVIVSGTEGRGARGVGFAAAVNTFGNICGVLIGGFVILSHFGTVTGLHVLAMTSISIGALCLLVTCAWHIIPRITVPTSALGMLLLLPGTIDLTALSQGGNVYFRTQSWGKVVDHAESLDGGLTTVNELQLPEIRLHTLLTNGKFQGNNSVQGEMVAQAGFALAPVLHTSEREAALVIGYGTGASARVLYDVGFRQLDIVDLSRDIVVLANRHFLNINDGVTSKSGVSTFITDGRNFLLLQNKSYDLISMEISSIWFAGAANLYNREFYKLVGTRLKPGGVFQQWVQLHHMATMDVVRIIGTLRSEFRYVWLYFIGGQGILVATNDEERQATEENIRVMDSRPQLRHALSGYEGSAKNIAGRVVLDPEGTDRLLAAMPFPPQHWISTDNNLLLEYSTPKGNVMDGGKSLDENLGMLRRNWSAQPTS